MDLHPLAQKRYEALNKVLQMGRFHHAYLFSGPKGGGKEMAARQLAKDMLCAAPLDGKACDRCETCHLFDIGNEPRYMVYEQAPNMEAVRQLRKRLGRSEDHLVICFQEAEALGREAANALLKTIEEPPAGVTFFFLAERPEMLLSTIRSRLQEVRFPAPPLRAEAEALLAERGDLDPTRFDKGLALSGDINGALRYAEDDDYRILADRLNDWLCHDEHRPAGQVFLLFGKLNPSRKKEEVPLLFEMAIHHYRQSYRRALLAGDLPRAKQQRRYLAIIMKEKTHLDTHIDAQNLLERALLLIAADF